MLRGIVVTVCIVCVSQTLEAEEICVSCESPAASYRCSVEQPAGDHQVPDAAHGHICENVLKQTGAHARCQAAAQQTPCEGAPRTVTMADYQKLVASDGHTTYQQGFLEKAQRCITSLFGDCE